MTAIVLQSQRHPVGWYCGANICIFFSLTKYSTSIYELSLILCRENRKIAENHNNWLSDERDINLPKQSGNTTKKRPEL